MNPARIASSDFEILKMLWSMMRLIFKTSSVTPDFFYVFNIILSFSNCSQSFKKSVRGNFWARTSLTLNDWSRGEKWILEIRGKQNFESRAEIPATTSGHP